MANPPPVPGNNDVVSTMVPYKNVPALVAYYLAVFSLIPVLGIPLGIGAVIFGIVGLQKAANHPEAKGKVHAWIGVIGGTVTTGGYAVLMALAMSKAG